VARVFDVALLTWLDAPNDRLLAELIPDSDVADSDSFLTDDSNGSYVGSLESDGNWMAERKLDQPAKLVIRNPA